MDSHSRSASPREPMRPQHRPPSPPASPGAFDNQAYQHDESDPNHNDSFASNTPQQNGHTKEPNGDAKTLEAVNLELINLTPKNGSAKKKDVEVDMNAANPYDEYFVPVNEHRKYMRGEKLYVTADKRGDKGGCKRPLCWTLLGLVVAAIVAIIVLAATGVLFTNSPTPLEQYNTSVSSARALGGIGHVHEHDHDHDHDHNHDHDHSTEHVDHSTDHDHSEEPTEHQHGPDLQQSDEAREPTSEEAGDSSMYVPRTVEGELKVDNEDYSPALQDPESNEYREFVASIADGIKRALFDRNSLDNGDNEISVEIIKLRKGSIIVTYRIHWKPKFNTEPTEDLLNSNKLKVKLDDYLSKNNRMINVYHIAESKLVTRPVLDICQINKNGCEHDCEFDEMALDFTCTCPHGQIIDMANPKRCIDILGSENEQKSMESNKGTDVTVLTVNGNPATTKMIPEEKTTTESAHTTIHTFDWKETHHRMPETTTEPESEVNFSHIFGNPTEKKPEHEQNQMDSSEATPSPEPEPKAEPEPAAEPEPTAELHPTAEPAPEPTTNPEPKSQPEPVPKSEPEPTVEPEPEPKPEPESEPKSEPEPEPEPEPAPEPVPEPISELKPKPETESEPEPEASSTTPSAEPIAFNTAFMAHDEHQLEAHTTSEPEPQAEHEPSQSVEPKVVTSENQQAMETDILQTPDHASEPESEPSPVTEESTKTTDHNQESHRHKDQSDNSVEKSILYTNEGKFEYKSNEETEAPEITTRRVSISEPNLINEPSYEPKPEIISIFSAKDRNNLDISRDEAPTTEISEWLEHKSQNSTKSDEHNETEIKDWLSQQSQDSAKSENHNQTQFEAILTNNVNKIMHESEQRSFKTFDDDFLFETTTTASIKNEDDSGTESTRRMEEDSKMPESISPVDEEKTESDIFQLETTTTMPSMKIMGESLKPKEEATTEFAISENEEMPENEKGAMISSRLEEAKSLETNKTVPTEATTEAETDQQISINKHYEESSEDTYLMDALETKPHTNKTTYETTSEREPEEGMDITFDAINMLYNRSSKSIEKKPTLQNNDKQETTEDPMSEATGTTRTTTESDWLSEAVTEINYDEAMNKMSKHETTEPPMKKIEEVMNRGMMKDDFEPDYLNNMGSTNNKPEQDEPLYGMVHDYDNEDSRFKRVNKEIITNNAKNATNEVEQNAKKVTETNSEVTVNMNIPKTMPIETTTISDYIYKVAEKSIYPENTLTVHNETETNKPLSPVESTKPATIMSQSEPVTDPEPAPVWEESDVDKYLTVKELPKPIKENTEIQRPVMIDEIQIPSTTIAPTNMETKSENSKNITETPTFSENSLNTTQLSNLNVTIYEISSHSNNNSVLLAKPGNAQSAEYDDHETEMNPFLPEVENNKSLVKKLQEGHDLEPNNLTETQNENTEEHAINTPEELPSNKDSLAVIGRDGDTEDQNDNAPTTEDYTLFNELLMNVNSRENEFPVTKDKNMTETDITSGVSDDSKTPNPEKKEALPISTFLMDTDDLITREPATTIRSDGMDSESFSPKISAPTVNNDSEFLSVVPINEDEDLLKKHKSENIEAELNDISDLSKSDKRTLDGTKFGSVTNNEA